MVSLASTIVRLFLRALSGRPEHPLVMLPEGQQRRSMPWSRRNWIVQAILLIHSRQQANLLDRDHLRRRVQGIARMPVVQFVVVLTIFLRSFAFPPLTLIRLGQPEIDHDFASTFTADFISIRAVVQLRGRPYTDIYSGVTEHCT